MAILTKWAVYSQAREKQWNDLDEKQVKFLYEVLPDSLRSSYFWWHDGLTDWKPLTELFSEQSRPSQPPVVEMKAELTDPKVKTAAKSTPSKATVSNASKSSGLLPRRFEGTAALTSPETLHLGFETGALSERRRSTRFQRKFTVRMILPSGVFKTETTDVSLNGISLKEPLPDGPRPRFINCSLDLGRFGLINIVCVAVIPKSGGAIHRLRIQVNDYEPKLKTALLA